MTIDTIEYSNAALKDGKSILIEGANATSTCIAHLLFLCSFLIIFTAFSFVPRHSILLQYPIIRIPLFLKLKFLTVYSD